MMVFNYRKNKNYFLLRDFEYSQILYDMAFLVQLAAIATNNEIPKFRLKSIIKAAYSIDGYSTIISEWLNDIKKETHLDYIPSSRIKKYLMSINQKGTIEELKNLWTPEAEGCLRLRSIRGIRKKYLAQLLYKTKKTKSIIETIASSCNVMPQDIHRIYFLENYGKWQSAHIIPPVMRFLNQIAVATSKRLKWKIKGIKDAITPVTQMFAVEICSKSFTFDESYIDKVINHCPLFRIVKISDDKYLIRHSMGWSFTICIQYEYESAQTLNELILKLDPLVQTIPNSIKSDLHMHTIWSDGLTPISELNEILLKKGLEYIAITDHSRSSKIQNGLTPVTWLKQAMAISKLNVRGKILHGLEVDILSDGQLDMPKGILNCMDIVIGSVHSGWGKNYIQNTNRILNAIESGYIDILGHPTALLYGKPGVPDYYRPPVNANWDLIFQHCARWQVGLEINCFPSRLDLSYDNILKASHAGCWISLGSDAHSKSHLELIKFGVATIKDIHNLKLLNSLSYVEIKDWLEDARKLRKRIPISRKVGIQLELFSSENKISTNSLAGTINTPITLPNGSTILGFDLTAGANKKTGVALLKGNEVKTTSLLTDVELINYIEETKPDIVSIDSPLGLPGGEDSILREAGIVREAEKDLSSIGIPSYPALIDSMKNLTLRGIKLRKIIKNLNNAPIVIESYPGAAQDLLGIPRKQNGLNYLRDGLKQLGLTGQGLKSSSHDEIDAVTCCVVGRFFEVGQYEPMGIPSEAQLIVPSYPILQFNQQPVICISGHSGSGKSIVARYLAVIYGFHWIRTRDIITSLIKKDFDKIPSEKLKINFNKPITEEQRKKIGIIILKDYNQKPIQQHLQKIILKTQRPIIIDSIRSISDVENISSNNHKLFKWYISCPDSMRIINLKKRNNHKAHSLGEYSDIDHAVIDLRSLSDSIILNDGSLEKLHWAIDDVFFSKTVELQRKIN